MKMSEFFKRPFKTPFDELDFSLTGSGSQVRDRLLSLHSDWGRISEMAGVAAHRMDLAEGRLDMASELAVAEIAEKHAGDRTYTAARKSAMAKNWKVLLPGDKEKTTPYEEEVKYYSYKYIAQRGKDRLKELGSIIDLGRSVLSWDKQELDRMEK